MTYGTEIIVLVAKLISEYLPQPEPNAIRVAKLLANF
jgi:hypothetical protein